MSEDLSVLPATEKYLVAIHPKFWEEKFGALTWLKMPLAEKKMKTGEYYDKIDKWLAGKASEYRSLFTGSFIDVTGAVVPYVKIELLDTDNSLARAELRDMIAAELYPQAIDAVSVMEQVEMDELCIACGLTPVSNSNYSSDQFDKMFAYKAYLMADAMLEARVLVKRNQQP